MGSDTMTDNEQKRVPVPIEADERQRKRLEEVRRRLEAGELDSDLALVETALALLDGDLPSV